jgi:fibronectin type 3 domain-containing protein
MNKRLNRIKSLSCGREVIKGILFLMTVALFVSCAKGFDGEETFASNVHDSQLASPELSKSSFSSVVNADGTESIRVTWDVVPGAGGYYCHVDNVDDPANPVVVYDGTVDGVSFLFDKADDTKYSVSVKTLGNEKLNNTAAPDPTVYAYSTMVEAQIIPVGTDIADFVNSHLIDTEDEQAFELQANGNYTLNSEVDFGTHKVTFRGDKIHRPIVTIGYDGVIRTAAGLKIKWIKFDTTEQNSKGVVECSNNPPPSLEGPNFGMPDKSYILNDPLIFEDCMFKNVKMCLFYIGEKAWSAIDVRIVNCIVQLDNDGTKFGDAAVLCCYGQTCYYKDGQSWGSSAIRNVTIKNSTIYNLKSNAKNRMIRFNRNNFTSMFDSATGSATLTDNTFIMTFSDKEFANNTPNNANYTITFNNNVTYYCARLQKFLQGNCTIINSVDKNTSYTTIASGDGAEFANDFKFVTKEDAFGLADVDAVKAWLKPLDLTKDDGGVNFKAKGAISSTIGDPRWLQ